MRQTFIKILLMLICALMFPASDYANAGAFTAFGPKTFVRSTGKPVVETFSFSIRTLDTTYTLKLYNGGLNSEYSKVSSAIVMLNGTTVFDNSDFSKQLTTLQKQVAASKSNILEVELRSEPDSTLTLILEGADNTPPEVSIINPANNTYTNIPEITVTGKVLDSISWVNAVTVNGKEGQLTGETYTSLNVRLAEGANTVTASAVDAAGNTANAPVKVLLDTIPPSIKISSPQDGSTVNSTKPAITVEYSDALSGIDASTARIAVDGLDVTDKAMITNNSVTYTPETALKDGAHTVTASVLDKAGNISTATISFTTKTRQRKPFIFPERGLMPEVII